MREIKYQAFIKEIGKCIEVEYLHIISEEVEVRLHPKGNTQLFSYSKENEEAILRQYTGLKDKNRVEIYQGDVVQLKAHQDFFIDFHNGSFVAKSTDKVQRINWIPSVLWEIVEMGYEVIGNIYENQELLNN